MADLPAHDAKTDRELLLLTVATVERLETKLDQQNGRITSLEHWRWWLTGILVVIGVLWPFLLYEVRQAVFG